MNKYFLYTRFQENPNFVVAFQQAFTGRVEPVAATFYTRFLNGGESDLRFDVTR